jgi:phage tail sheath protein FI
MPEYLSPGVYVEEVDTGSKPIEGVSTSTCGVVGVCERGPVDVPVLVTSVGEYVRWFGGLLRADDYGVHRFLPHAIDGFFTNGGKRVYVVRVLDPAATKASGSLFHADPAAAVASALLRPAGEGTGSGATPPALLVLPGTGLATGDWVRVGDGSDAEYRRVAAAPAADTVAVTVDLPLARSHAAGEDVKEHTRVAVKTFATVDDAGAGTGQLLVQGQTADVAGALTAGTVVEIGAVGLAEYRVVREATSATVVSGTDSTVRLALDAPLVLPHAAASAVVTLNLTAATTSTTVVQATAGTPLLFVANNQGAFTDRTHLVSIGTGDLSEVRRVGERDELAVSPATGGAAAGSLIEAVTFAGRALAANAAAGATTLTLQPGTSAGLVAGQRVVLDPAGSPQTLTVLSVTATTDVVGVTPALTAAHATGQALVPAAKTTTAAVVAGGRVLALDDRMGLAEGRVVRVGTGAAAQLVTVLSTPAATAVAPDAGNLVVDPPLVAAWPTGTTVAPLGDPVPVAGRQTCVLVLAAPSGASALLVSDGHSFATGDTVRLTGGGATAFHTLTAAAAAAPAQQVTVDRPLARAHPAGSVIVERTPLADVEALDAGIWGNRLRVSVEPETPGQLVSTTLAVMVNPTTIRLASASGVQAGTVLTLFDPVTGAQLGDPVKVSNLNRTAQNTITLAGTGLGAAQQVIGAVVQSLEFRLTVRLLRQPDPAVPSRDSQVIDLETFRSLSLDPRHSNYIEKVVGATDGPERRWDHRPEGASLYVRVKDLAASPADAEAARTGPEMLVDVLPDGRTVPARLRLEQVQGDDAIGSIGDSTYLGADSTEPDDRTGLYSLQNIEEISLVAVPGQTRPAVQQGVIDHCELLRYRFAVLDAVPEPADTLSDVQNQRQQFDTKYAAMYHPWLSIPDPFPAIPAQVQDYPVPPAGHMLGVYARTDVDRGVHKAPANEVVRGITGLRRRLNKGEQDILNPYPVNVNVIRDFRDDNRAIRAFGARVITSDPDWKYVNVRRLTIFIEASLDRGLQWVVFEPNDDALWARVRRVVSNFLTTVWRSGALEGTRVEEAYFVRCDRTTMTQTDIDNGRLIIVVGIAPVKPAEFVIVRIGLWTAHADT